MPKPTTTEEYLAGVPEPARATLEELRKRIKTAAPDAVELMSYGMPAFKISGDLIAGFAAFKNHCSYFPMSGGVVEMLKSDLASYKTSKGSIQFPTTQALPPDLVTKLVQARRVEIEAKKHAPKI